MLPFPKPTHTHLTSLTYAQNKPIKFLIYLQLLLKLSAPALEYDLLGAR
jgi:hypothetical protein